ncbi:MAG: hypothetical protein IT303_06940 [Dehalococcoidia bacterium]|nr:hypothetical protein [Dehalococcoidia bacterium]
MDRARIGRDGFLSHQGMDDDDAVLDAGGPILGEDVRGGAEASVWDDTDIVHVVREARDSRSIGFESVAAGDVNGDGAATLLDFEDQAPPAGFTEYGAGIGDVFGQAAGGGHDGLGDALRDLEIDI